MSTGVPVGFGLDRGAVAQRSAWTAAAASASSIAGREAAWAFFGGVFRTVIPDNMAAIVHRADALEPRLNQAFVEYAQARGFHLDPARVRHPKDKRRVERAVQFAR